MDGHPNGCQVVHTLLDQVLEPLMLITHWFSELKVTYKTIVRSLEDLLTSANVLTG